MKHAKVRARYSVPFEDIDYESWTRDCGATFIKLEPRMNAPYELEIEGSAEAIRTFSRDLGRDPKSTWRGT